MDCPSCTTPAKGQAGERPSLLRKDISVTVLLEANVPQTMIVIGGWSGFGKGSDQMVGVIGARALQKRLFHEIRENMGAKYGVSAQLVPLIADPIIFSMTISVAHDRAAEVLSIMHREHKKFLTDGISQNELDAERLALRTESEEAFRRPPQAAAFLRDAVLSGQPSNYVETFMDRLSALSLAETNSVLKSRLADRKISAIVVAPTVGQLPGNCTIKTVEEISQCERFK